jgi:endonuclease/exonuclease/phosphatase family metal-dependent hydrolase
VPESIPGDFKAPRAIRPARFSPDVEALGRDLRMSVAYAPSMRNGMATSIDEREDRGSAVLSTEPLVEATAIELPFGRQRRVAVAATIRPRHPDAASLRVVTGHFDTGPLKVLQARHLRDWLKALPPGTPTILGLDTNAVLGSVDPAVRTVASALPIENCGRGNTLELWPFRVDFIFSNLGSSPRRACETLRDRHGSDHRPLLLTIRY